MQNKANGNNQYSSLRHFGAADLDVSGRNVLIVGKGPSYDAETIERLKKDNDFVLCSINNAWTGSSCVFDLCVFGDWPVAARFDRFDSVACFITGVHPIGPNGDISRGLKNYDKMKSKLYFFDFDGENKPRIFPDTEKIKIRTSTVEAAAEIACQLGAKSITFIGVDGTHRYHRAFGLREHKNALASQFCGLRKTHEKYKIPFNFIKEESNVTWKPKR